ncbi:MAG: hypothetical protein K6C33_00440 [Desulfovibrio sp.]|nr:hypothetical protein [Desulfovibrio sp.]
MPIYGLSYHKLAQTSYYQSDVDLARNEKAVVDLDQGRSLARVVSGPHADLESLDEDALPRIVRRATAEDLEQERENAELAFKARGYWAACVKRRRLDMKLVDVEIFLDRSKFIFYFTAPARIDFRELVKDLVHEYRVRIELRQIGVRHEAQMVGAVGNCGMVCCCRRYLRQFAPVTIRMAKEQNLFLNPSKVSGICGRLLCCLSYEQEAYDSFHRESPRLGKHYQTERGQLKVVRTNMFCSSVTCVNAQNEELLFSLEEWKALKPKRTDAGPQEGESEPRQSGQPSRDELLVVQATPDSVADPDFFNDFFPPGSENYDGSASFGDPVMEPGEGESRAKPRRRRKSSRPAPQTGRPASLHAERPEKPEQHDRPERPEKPERSEHAERQERRPASVSAPGDDERRNAAQRDAGQRQAPARRRADHRERFDRPDRPERHERADRPDRLDRAERPERSDRAGRGERPERSERPERREGPASRPPRRGGREAPRRPRPHQDLSERPDRPDRPERLQGRPQPQTAPDSSPPGQPQEQQDRRQGQPGQTGQDQSSSGGQQE